MLAIRLILILIMLFSGGSMDNTQDSILDYFALSQEIVVYNNDKQVTIENESNEFQDIIDVMHDMCLDSHEMPAFGVSLDNETRLAMKSGLWIEFRFDKQYIYSEMPFDRLLISVDAESSGFNIIRYHNDMYEGRCYYLNLNNDMSALQSTLIQII